MRSHFNSDERFVLPFTVATLLLVFWLAPLRSVAAPSPDLAGEPYQLDTGLISRSISFENPTGAPSEGGKAASNLGPGRKGAPSRDIKPGETVQLCDIAGPGTIRHIWMTTTGDPERPARVRHSRLVGRAGASQYRVSHRRPFRIRARQDHGLSVGGAFVRADRRPESLVAHAIRTTGPVHLHQRR